MYQTSFARKLGIPLEKRPRASMYIIRLRILDNGQRLIQAEFPPNDRGNVINDGIINFPFFGNCNVVLKCLASGSNYRNPHIGRGYYLVNIRPDNSNITILQPSFPQNNPGNEMYCGKINIPTIGMCQIWIKYVA